jgi:6-phosphogluconolactonase
MNKILLGILSLFLLSGQRPAQPPASAEATAGRPAAAKAAAGKADELIMFVGTYTRAPSKGIYAYRFQGATGEVTPLGTDGLAAETENPSFLAVHPNQRFLYAVNEVSRYEGAAAGSVSAFSIDRATGTLTLLNRVSSRGGSPCHLELDRSGKWLFVANYGGGSVAAFPVQGDGKLGEASAFFQHAGSSVNKARQSGPHGHATVVSPDNKFVLAADLGLDKILTYRIDAAKGGLVPADPPFSAIKPGSGPRHLAFRPDGKFAYVLNEMLSSVGAYAYDAGRGSLRELQTVSTLPEGFSADNSGAEIVSHPTGKFLYTSNRGHDSIAMFRIDAAKGTLTAAGHVSTQGKTPRGFGIDPSGSFLVAGNQNSGTVVMFRIDPATGGLTPTGITLQVGSPVNVVFSKRTP